MKGIIGFAFFCFLIMSCSLTKPSMIQEDELLLTRKYIGNFIEYFHTEPKSFGDPHLIWIKTSLEGTYGRITAYSKTCKFQPGERLYIRRVYDQMGGVWGDWVYQIESDNDNTNYRLSQFPYADTTLVQTWF